MSLLICDGFDNYTFLPLKWDTATYKNNFSIETGLGRKGGNALTYFGDITYPDSYIGKNLGKDCSSTILGFAYKSIDGMPGYLEIGFYYNNIKQSFVRIFSKDIVLYSADSVVYNGLVNCITPHKWGYIELKTTYDTVSGTVDLHIDGASVGSYSGVSTTTSGTLVNEVRFKGQAPYDLAQFALFIDDFYIADMEESYNNDFLGNCEVTTLYPTNQATYSEFLPTPDYTGVENYTLVNGNFTNDITTYSGVFLVLSGEDDGYDINNSSTVNTFSTNTPLIADEQFYRSRETNSNYFWFRFSDVSIPRNAIILSANIDIHREYFSETTPSENDLFIYAERSGIGSPAYTTLGQVYDITSTYTILRQDSDTDLNTINLSSIIQELVKLPDWQEGLNSCTMIMHYAYIESTTWTHVSYRSADYYNDPYHPEAPKINITWQMPNKYAEKYIQTSSLNVRDTYNTTTSGLSDIVALNHNVFTKKDTYLPTSSDMGLSPLAHIEGVTYSGSPCTPSGGYYKCLNLISEKNQATDAPWLFSELGTTEFGFITTPPE